MKFTHLFFGAILAMTVCVCSLSAQSIEGSYQAQGAAPEGKAPYTGKVTITKDVAVYKIGWNLGTAGSYQGTGLLVGDVLAAAYGGGKPYGLVVYKVDGGKLSGQWTGGGESALGEENLEGPAGLSGTYKITSAKDSKGNEYSGTVAISKSGSVYKLKWTLPSESYNGIGILQGNLLVVAWGEGTQFGAVAYNVKDGKLSGPWVAGNGSALGTETLSK